MRFNILRSWAGELEAEFNQSESYMSDLRQFLLSEYRNRKIFPDYDRIFGALEETLLDEVKVVIIGQDPYHNGKSNGLAFSMQEQETEWPSNNALKQIFKAVRNDGYTAPFRPCSLVPWARQGVLLLNSILTVREHCPGSHKCQGWEQFTDRIVEIVSTKQYFVVFLLWGDDAEKKDKKIDQSKHKILYASHPINLGGATFVSSKHFSKANCYLKNKGYLCIDWSLISDRS